MPKRRDDNAYYWKRLRHAEKTLLEDALRVHTSVREAARVLGVSPNYVSERLAVLKIPAPNTRPGPKPKTPPLPSSALPLSEAVFALVAENLVDVIAEIVRSDRAVLADCRFIVGLLRRGIYTRREAATLLHRIQIKRRFDATREGVKK